MPRKTGPLFYLQIVDVDKREVAVVPGGGPLEAEIIDLAAKYIIARGVRFRTQKHIEQDIRDGLREAIMSLKEQTKFIR